MTTLTDVHDLTLTRTFPIARERLFDMWLDPEGLKRWFFPTDVDLESLEADPRDGGSLEMVMRGKQSGNAYVMVIDYQAIERPSVIRMSQGWRQPDGTVPQRFALTVTFEDVPEGTRLTLHEAGFDSPAGATQHTEGWGYVLDHLATAI